jgi:hypothetical protein
MTSPLLARRDAAQAAVDAFLGQAFAWGQVDCVRLAASVLNHHGLPCDLNRAGTWDSPLKARRALKRLGYSGLGEAVDGQGLARIPFAFHLVGDLVGLPSSEGWDLSLGVCLGNGRVLAFSPHDHQAGVLQPDAEDILACWRVDPWPKP